MAKNVDNGVAKARKELILEGLDCANCSSKIESEVNKISGVKASMNFMTKTLTVEAESEQSLDDIIERIGDIAEKYEPNIRIREKVINKYAKKTLILVGLECANCAARIETQIRNIAGIKSATVDFISKKVTLEADDKYELNRIVKEAESVIKSIEPDVKVVDGEENKELKASEKEKDEEGNNKSKIIKLVAGGILFALGLLLDLNVWAELLVLLAAYVTVGGEILLRAFKNIVRGQVFDENFLMSIATIGAFIIGEFPEGVAVMLFYQVGELFQDMAVNRSRKSISDLMDIRPDYANLKLEDGVKKVSPTEVTVGDIIVVKPGEKIPLDGKVLAGSSMVDTSALTGESVLREVENGDDVLSGFINKNGVLTIEVTKEFGESTVSKILDLVQNAGSRKAPTENFITKFARYYTPAVVVMAVLIAVIPPLIIKDAVFSEWLYRALSFLVISCPCALVVSIPLGFFGGIGGASKTGILIKGSNYLEALNNVETVIFDKTGTLTKGVFNVTQITPANGFTKEELLEYAAYAESYSNHPIALSILKAYGKEVDKSKLESYDEITGYGIKAKAFGKVILAGNSKLLSGENIVFEKVETIGTAVYIAVDGVYCGNIIISDEVKPDSASAVKAIKELGVKNTVMLTGDVKSVGEQIGSQLGIDVVYSELLPDEKVEKLEMYDRQKSPKSKLVFAGDGINDAPVLARADIGVAMGGLGSDAAIEAADIVIMTDEPSKIAEAIRIARKTKAIVMQNIVFAIGIKLIFLVMVAFGVSTMWEAVFADVGVSVLAVLNSMRAMKVKNISQAK